MVEPLLDEARRDGRRLRLLVRIGPEYQGFTAGVVWEKAEASFGTPSLLRLFDGYALVTPKRWIVIRRARPAELSSFALG